MSGSEILICHSDGMLRPAPIPPLWVVQGRPTASNRILSRSKDRMAITVIWDCTAGMFNWFYDSEETIYVLEGSATLTVDGMLQPIGPGSVVVFPAGSQALWEVDHYIRKLAVFRQPVPQPLSLCMRVWRRFVAVGIAKQKLTSPAIA